MKCSSCANLWYIPKCQDAPYGEYACMANDDPQDLYGIIAEDVKDCKDYVDWREKTCPTKE